jgi:hypothetical protein
MVESALENLAGFETESQKDDRVTISPCNTEDNDDASSSSFPFVHDHQVPRVIWIRGGINARYLTAKEGGLDQTTDFLC